MEGVIKIRYSLLLKVKKLIHVIQCVYYILSLVVRFMIGFNGS